MQLFVLVLVWVLLLLLELVPLVLESVQPWPQLRPPAEVVVVVEVADFFVDK